MALNIFTINHTLTELNTAVREHYDWSLKMLKLCILGGNPDNDLIGVNAHQYCSFSHWLEQKANDATLCTKVWTSIDQTHEAMHHTAKHLLYAIKDGSANAEKINAYHHAQCLFIDSIDHYKATLIAYRNKLDTLTGLPLRQLLYEDYKLRIARSQRSQHTVYLLMLDIDRFKSINDTYGHNAGDEVLKVVAHRLRAGTRSAEALYRFGGEEFIALFDADDDTTASAVADRLCQRLSQAPVVIADGSRLTVTVTGGLTQTYGDESLQNAIGRADKALYQGKRNGRNRFVMVKAEGVFLDMGKQIESIG